MLKVLFKETCVGVWIQRRGQLWRAGSSLQHAKGGHGSGAISSAFLLSSLQLLFTFLCLLDVNYHLYTLIMSLVLGRSIIGKSDFQSTCNDEFANLKTTVLKRLSHSQRSVCIKLKDNNLQLKEKNKGFRHLLFVLDPFVRETSITMN